MVKSDQLQTLFVNKRTVIVGVGNTQRSDDAAGSLLAQRLKSQGVDVIDGADVPENFTGEVKARSPEVILFVDAVDFGGRAGEIVLLKTEQLSHDRFSTHRPSLGMVANYLTTETKAEVLLLGIQPENTEMGTNLSSSVAETIEMLVKLITALQRT